MPLVYDFVHDQFANGRRFRVLTMVDDVTRECLAAVPDTSMCGKRVAREMDALIARRRGSPGRLSGATSYVRNLSLVRHQIMGHPCDRIPLSMVAQAGSAVKKRSLP